MAIPVTEYRSGIPVNTTESIEREADILAETAQLWAIPLDVRFGSFSAGFATVKTQAL